MFTAYLRPTRDRAVKRSRRAGGGVSVNQVLARAIRYAQEGRVSRALQALEAAEMAPPTMATLQELIALHPPQFVPTECPRRAAVDEGVAAARRKHGWKKLDYKKFKEECASFTSEAILTTTGTTEQTLSFNGARAPPPTHAGAREQERERAG